MALQSLLKAKDIKENPKTISLDYTNIDPTQLIEGEKIQEKEILLLKEVENRISKLEQQVKLRHKKIISEAQLQADQMLHNAKTESENEIRRIKTETENYLKAEQESLAYESELLKKAYAERDKELEEFKNKARKEIEVEVWKTIREEATKTAQLEYSRLIDQVHSILNAAIATRRDILGQSEKEITELVVLIARKVVKVISEKNDNVVVQNVVQALGKLKGREKFLIRINTKNLTKVQEFIPKIKSLLEINGTITLVEDTKVDIGGCIIETEFGDVDARINTQLAAIEKTIRDTELLENVKF